MAGWDVVKVLQHCGRTRDKAVRKILSNRAGADGSFETGKVPNSFGFSADKPIVTDGSIINRPRAGVVSDEMQGLSVANGDDKLAVQFPGEVDTVSVVCFDKRGGWATERTTPANRDAAGAFDELATDCPDSFGSASMCEAGLHSVKDRLVR